MPDKSRPLVVAAMQRVLHSEPGRTLTLREVSEKAGVSIGTVHKMSQGYVPHCESVIRVAKAFEEVVADWLEICGYEDIANDYRGVVVSKPRYDEDAEMVTSTIKRIPEKNQDLARKAIRMHLQKVIVPLFTEAA